MFFLTFTFLPHLYVPPCDVQASEPANRPDFGTLITVLKKMKDANPAKASSFVNTAAVRQSGGGQIMPNSLPPNSQALNSHQPPSQAAPKLSQRASPPLQAAQVYRMQTCMGVHLLVIITFTPLLSGSRSRLTTFSA